MMTLVSDYLDEPVILGPDGEWLTRGQLIVELQSAGHPQRCIDAYLAGLDSNR